METQATIVVKDRKKVEGKEGKKPFWVLTGDDGIEYTTFEESVAAQCPAGSSIEVKVKTSKVGNKTYFNLSELISSNPPPQEQGQLPPVMPPGNALTPEMVAQITQLFKSFMMFGPEAKGGNGWVERDSHIARQAMIRCACMNGASGDDAIVLAEHYYKYVMVGTPYAEKTIGRIQQTGRTPDANIIWINNGFKEIPQSSREAPASSSTTPDTQSPVGIENDWTKFYQVARTMGFEKPSDVTKALGVRSISDWHDTKEAALDFLGQLVGIDWRTGEVAGAIG